MAASAQAIRNLRSKPSPPAPLPEGLMHDSFWTDGKMRDKHQFIIETTTHLQPPLEQAQPQVEYAASPGSASSQFPTQLRGTDYPSAQADHPNISQGHCPATTD